MYPTGVHGSHKEIMVVCRKDSRKNSVSKFPMGIT